MRGNNNHHTISILLLISVFGWINLTITDAQAAARQGVPGRRVGGGSRCFQQVVYTPVQFELRLHDHAVR